MAKKLPEYQNPPVTEVALSVTFSPLEKWKSAHSGLYWSKVLTRYPLTEVYPELPHQIENFDDVQPPTVSIQFEMFNPDNQRYLFLTEPSTRVIQVQRDRFVTNWRQIDGDEPYPRYRADLRPTFEREAFVVDRRAGHGRLVAVGSFSAYGSGIGCAGFD